MLQKENQIFGVYLIFKKFLFQNQTLIYLNDSVIIGSFD